MIFKKIAVCYGKACGPAGAEKIQNILEKEYDVQGVQITQCTCCGRCERHNSIVIDDGVIISDLSSKNIVKNFIADPKGACEKAQKEKNESEAKLEKVLSDDLLL